MLILCTKGYKGKPQSNRYTVIDLKYDQKQCRVKMFFNASSALFA